ncbi:MAG: permease [Armatimonadota bacterium]|nr:permease [Armatimonadota bacterium]MDR7539691.1 permease [Armatimonadota bacterium]
MIYTGSILGAGVAWTRVLTALAMAFIVGWAMTLALRREEAQRLEKQPGNAKSRILSATDLTILALLVVALLAPNYLVRGGPYVQRVAVWAAGMTLVAAYACWKKTREQVRRWLEETWWFVRVIFPLLLVGVFIVGVIGPGLSLPNWLAIGRVLGAKKAVVYVGTIIVLGTIGGWFAGTFIFR